MIKIFNRILWGIKPPENKSDIWFDGDVFKIYRKGDWEAITIEIDAASKLADVIKNINDVYQTKLTEGDGILLEDSKISVRRMFQVVSELPKTGEYNTIYLLVENNKEIGSYIYVNNEWMSLVSTIEIDKNLNIYSTNPVENKAVTKKIESLDVVRIVDGGVSGLESGNFRDGSVGSAISSDHALAGVTLTREHVGCTIQGVKWIHKGGLILFPNFGVNTSCTINLRNNYGDIGSIKMYYRDITSLDIDIILPNEHITLMKNSNVFLPENVNTVLTNKLAYYQIVGIYNNGFDVDSFAPYFQFDLTRDVRELYFKNGDWKKVLIEDNVKTINGHSILGDGNIEVSSGGSSYDDTELNSKVNGLQTQIDTLVNGDASAAIESFNEITNFLKGIEDAESLESIIAGIEQKITNKQDTIADLDTIRRGSALGATALQTVPKGYATETWVSTEIAKAQLEGEGVDPSGFATKDDIKGLATKEETEAVKTWVGEQGFLTEHQSLDGLATEQFVTEKISEIQIPEIDNLATKEEVNEIAEQIPTIDGLATETYVEEKIASINIPSIEGLATEEWVKEQNYLTEHQDITGKQDLINDLEAIRDGAAKGATALQRIDYPQLEDNLIDSGFYHSSDGMLHRSDMEDAVQESLNKADSALQSENDPIFSASPAASITTEKMLEWGAKQDLIADLDTIRSGAEKGATALQEHQSLAGYATESFVNGAISTAITNTINASY